MNMNVNLLKFLAVLALVAGCKQPAGQGPTSSDEEKVTFYRTLSPLEEQWRDSVRTALAEGYKEKKLVIGTNTMPIWWTVYGEQPADGRSLYISLHGGGGAPAELNDQQWDNQKRL